MTVVSPALSIEQARALIREAGLRSTGSRLAVIQHLSAAQQPRSHAEVAEALVPAGYEKSTLYREFQAEREEILRHKWIESEKVGYDIGFEHALTDWIMKHRSKWRRGRHPSDKDKK